MTREEQALKLVQDENQQLRIALAAKQAELETFMASVGSEHVTMAKMILDGAVHIFRAARTNKTVKDDVERLLIEVDAYMALRGKLLIAGSGKTQ